MPARCWPSSKPAPSWTAGAGAPQDLTRRSGRGLGLRAQHSNLLRPTDGARDVETVLELDLHIDQQMSAEESLRLGEVVSLIDNLYGDGVIHWR